MIILILLAIIGGIVISKVINKPKEIVLQRKKPSQSEKVIKRLECEWDHFNNLRANEHAETENTIEMIGALEQELKCQLRRVK